MQEALKPCPFCGGEADCNNTGICDKDGKPMWWVECPQCGISTSGNYEKQPEIAAWNRRAEPANEPLTLEQLREMNGEPVWCVDAKGRGIWALVHTRDAVCTDADFEDWEFYCYGWMDSEVGWFAYKRKVEERA